MPLLVMCSADEKRQSCKNSKISAASAQNDDFYCKKWSFALLLLTNPLYYTIIHNIAMGVVAIGSFVIDHLTTVGDHHSDFADFGFWMMKFEFQTKTAGETLSFLIHHGKHHLFVATDPVGHFLSFQHC